MSSYKKQFRDIFYKTSLPIGDVMSFNLMNNSLGGIRRQALGFARINADFKSLTAGGQGPSLRIQRRLVGRGAGLIGRTLIPQKLGPITRVSNRVYGKFASIKVQSYFNYKMGYDIKVRGRVLTEYAKDEIMKQNGKKLGAEYAKIVNDYKKKGIDIREFSLPELMRDIQFNMLGFSSTPGAPVATGNLRDSIRLRGISLYSKSAMIKGRITVGQSKGAKGKIADQAPYWWKTVYGGYYRDDHSFFTPARNRDWLGKSIMGAMTHHFPEGGFKVVVNRQKRDDIFNYKSYQPNPPKATDFVLCHLNTIQDTTGFLEYLLDEDAERQV